MARENVKRIFATRRFHLAALLFIFISCDKDESKEVSKDYAVCNNILICAGSDTGE